MNGMTMKLRLYQREALRSMFWSHKLVGADVFVMPTGSGKSVVIAEFVRALGEDVLILCPSREILMQDMDKLTNWVDREEIGVYSASMGEKTINKFTFATINSVYKNAELFKRFKTVIIDECDLLNPRKFDGMYKKFFAVLQGVKVIGLTATPFRLDTKYIRHSEYYIETKTVTRMITRMQPRFWYRLTNVVSYGELLKDGYLSPLKYILASKTPHKDIPRNKSNSEFDIIRFKKMLEEQRDLIVRGIAWAENNFKSVLVFCNSIEEAEELSGLFTGSAVVTGKTPSKIRAGIIEKFKSGEVQTVFNVDVLTVGFDHPGLDCIVMCRPTRSIRKYQQMIGRGTRIAPGKTKCTVIDFAGNVDSIGKLETIEIKKDMEFKWNVKSEKGFWHEKELYRFDIIIEA